MKQLLTLALLATMFVSCSDTNQRSGQRTVKKVRAAKLVKTGYTIAVNGIPEELRGVLLPQEEIIVSYSSNDMKWHFDETPVFKFNGPDTLLVGNGYSFAYYKAILN
jgi:hypothetical protein